MRKTIALIACAGIMFSSAAQAGSSKELAHYVDVKPGQSQAQVVEIMGEPGNREFNGKKEAWQYCAKSGLTSNKFVVVFFDEEHVERLSTYTRPWMGGCKGQYKPAIWDASTDSKGE